MKKLLNLFLVLCIILLPSNALASSENSFNNVADNILNDENISEDIKDWFLWFNNLNAYEQSKINYRPVELSKYNYEKNINFNASFLDTNFILDRAIHEYSLIPMSPVHPDIGNRILPIAGYELKYNPTYWNKNRYKANCYTYALNFLATTNRISHQPGYASGARFGSLTKSSIINAVKRDVNYLSNVKGFRSAGEKEKPGYREYKVALVIGNVDYHWYRQDSDGYWSHKSGVTNISRSDASGRSIINPRTANNNYSHANYHTFAGFYFVKY